MAEFDEDEYRRERERSELVKAGFVQVGPTTWVAARHVESVELTPGEGQKVRMVSGNLLTVDAEYPADLASDLSSTTLNDRDRYEQVVYREVSGSVTAYTTG